VVYRPARALIFLKVRGARGQTIRARGSDLKGRDVRGTCRENSHSLDYSTTCSRGDSDRRLAVSRRFLKLAIRGDLWRVPRCKIHGVARGPPITAARQIEGVDRAPLKQTATSDDVVAVAGDRRFACRENAVEKARTRTKHRRSRD